MAKDYDEPMFIDVKRSNNQDESNSSVSDAIIDSIKDLCVDQSFAVLATQGTDQPYTSLISFATTEDLKYIVFATPVQTRKYNLLKHNQKVSVLIDNRSNQPDSINRISALTAIGSVQILTEQEDIDKWSDILIDKHKYLNNFINAGSTAIILIEISKYFYVRRFQEVVEWTPKNS